MLPFVPQDPSSCRVSSALRGECRGPSRGTSLKGQRQCWCGLLGHGTGTAYLVLGEAVHGSFSQWGLAIASDPLSPSFLDHGWAQSGLRAGRAWRLLSMSSLSYPRAHSCRLTSGMPGFSAISLLTCPLEGEPVMPAI